MTAPITTATATERMRTPDAEFFFAEHGNVPLHIGSVAVFDGPAPAREDLMRLFEAKLPLVPRYRQVVRTAPFQLLRHSRQLTEFLRDFRQAAGQLFGNSVRQSGLRSRVRTRGRVTCDAARPRSREPA